jgi:hypothetical protein
MGAQIHIVTGVDYDVFEIDSAWLSKKKAEERREELHSNEFTKGGVRRAGATGLYWTVESFDIKDAVVSEMPKYNPAGEILAILERMNGGPIEPAKTSLSDYVTERRDWVIVAGNTRIPVVGHTREELDRLVRSLEAGHAVVYVQGDP